MKKLPFLLITTAMLSACATEPPPPPPPPPPPVDTSSPLYGPNFLQTATSSDQFEIQSSQLALQMSQNPAVRSFAQTMITDHTRLGNQMMAAAQSAGLTLPPPALLPQDQQTLDSLRASGANFDVAYRDAQVSGHQAALTLMQGYAANGDTPALRSVAAGAVPIVQSHLAMAQALAVSAPPPPPPPTPSGERG